MVGLPRESRISRAATSSMVVKSFVLFGINKSSAIAMYLHGSVVLLIVHPRQISRLLLHPCGPIVHRGRVVEQVKNNGRARFISPRIDISIRGLINRAPTGFRSLTMHGSMRQCARADQR